MKARILSTVAVVGMVMGMASAAHAIGLPNTGSRVGNAVSNAAEKAVTNAVKGAVMQPRTKCTCGASGVDAKCAAKLAAEIGGKQMIAGSAGENHSYWLKCDVYGETTAMADTCRRGLEQTLSTVGASRTNFYSKTKGSDIKCSVELY